MEKACRIISNPKRLYLFRFTITRLMMTTPKLRAAAEQATEELKTNPYYEKYATKIASLQQTNPEEFLSRVGATQTEKGKPKSDSTPDNARPYSSLLTPKPHSMTKPEAQSKSLDSIMKLDLVIDKTSSEIANIWKEYHLKKDFITATIPSATFNNLMEKARKYPMFLFPIPRSQGYEFILSQFSGNSVYFTTLLAYQVHKENAPECLTITHYTDFKESKEIVLMRGEFDKAVLNVQEAQCLANQLQLYYGQDDASKNELLERFTKKPDEFKHMDVIKQIETLSIN